MDKEMLKAEKERAKAQKAALKEAEKRRKDAEKLEARRLKEQAKLAKKGGGVGVRHSPSFTFSPTCKPRKGQVARVRRS